MTNIDIMKIYATMKGVRIVISNNKYSKEIADKFGKAIHFHCNSCHKFIATLWELDIKEGFKFSKQLKYCARCGNRLDFGDLQHKED